MPRFHDNIGISIYIIISVFCLLITLLHWSLQNGPDKLLFFICPFSLFCTEIVMNKRCRSTLHRYANLWCYLLFWICSFNKIKTFYNKSFTENANNWYILFINYSFCWYLQLVSKKKLRKRKKRNTTPPLFVSQKTFIFWNIKIIQPFEESCHKCPVYKDKLL